MSDRFGVTTDRQSGERRGMGRAMRFRDAARPEVPPAEARLGRLREEARAGRTALRAQPLPDPIDWAYQGSPAPAGPDRQSHPGGPDPADPGRQSHPGGPDPADPGRRNHLGGPFPGDADGRGYRDAPSSGNVSSRGHQTRDAVYRGSTTTAPEPVGAATAGARPAASSSAVGRPAALVQAPPTRRPRAAAASNPARVEADKAHRPMYARMLRLRHVAPSGFLCFVFLEGTVALGILLALAELVSWWGVLVLPAAVAGMVKLNDMVAGVLERQLAASPAGSRPSPPPSSSSPGSGPQPPSSSSPGSGSRPPLSSGPESGADDRSPSASAAHEPFLPAAPNRLTGPYTNNRHARDAWIRPPAEEAALEGPTPAMPALPGIDNGARPARQWADDIDDQQRSRQSAARRYE
ncbi:hypothetical protein [Symbioplanes lichenis]|uniref:hypothetical protein n=1 Tax=Symbioplanes lichenis TaxID=1629072 RepID=UPI0034DB0D37